jgi:Pyridoxal-phosphate dependent enzyme
MFSTGQAVRCRPPSYMTNLETLRTKCTFLQVFSFKLRGAFNKMAQLTPEELARGVITSSAGNHAQGVALAASHLVSNGCNALDYFGPLPNTYSRGLQFCSPHPAERPGRQSRRAAPDNFAVECRAASR